MPDRDPHRLIMGVFSPIIDYLIVKLIREPLMGTSHVDNTIARYLTDFGYAPGDVAAGFLDVTPVRVDDMVRQRRVPVAERPVAFLATGGSGRTVRLTVGMPQGAGEVPVSVFDVSGRLVRTLSLGSSAVEITWDGCDGSGRAVAPGAYVVRVGAMVGGTPYSLNFI